MKREIELAKLILHDVEESENDLKSSELAYDKYKSESVIYNLKLLIDVGYITGRDVSSNDGFEYYNLTMTSAGHDFFDAIRTNAGWSAVTHAVKKQGSEIPFSIVKDVAAAGLKIALNLV